MSSSKTQSKTGIGHFNSILGSDSVHSAFTATTHYGFKNDLPLAFSVPATEHSIMCLGIALSSEEDTFRRLLKQYNTGITQSFQTLMTTGTLSLTSLQT